MTTSRFCYGLLAIILAVLLHPVPAGAMPSSLNYSVQWVNHTRVHVIIVDLNDQSLMITPQLARDTVGERQSFITFLAAHHPLAQITGSYFSLNNALPIGDVVIGGHIRYRGPVGSALAIKEDNTADIVNVPYGWTYSWPGYENVLKGGMRLVQHGKYAVFPHDQGFRDPDLFRPASRTAVGLTRKKKLVLVAVNQEILLSQLARIMKELGCCDAMTLDGGLSTGMAFGDDIIVAPGRTLPSVLMVLPRPNPPTAKTSAGQSSNSLAPTSSRHSAATPPATPAPIKPTIGPQALFHLNRLHLARAERRAALSHFTKNVSLTVLNADSPACTHALCLPRQSRLLQGRHSSE